MNELVRQKIDDFFVQFPSKHYDKGQLLVQANEDPPGIFRIVSGQVRQYDISDQGNEIVVNVFKAPAFFPMSWAITKTSNRYFFEASESLEVRMAPAADAVEFLKQNSDVMFDLLHRLYSGAEGMQRRMAHLMGGTAETRVIFELVIACKRFGEIQPNGSLSIDINEEELAHRCGMARETINREISSLKNRGLVAVEHGHMIIKDMQQLERDLGDRL